MNSGSSYCPASTTGNAPETFARFDVGEPVNDDVMLCVDERDSGSVHVHVCTNVCCSYEAEAY